METVNNKPIIVNPYQEAENIIQKSNNIYIITSESHEAYAASMALFYILKEYQKNANLIYNAIPENLKFLAPSLDFISYPKNFVISIPTKSVQISKIDHEKDAESLKIHLLLEHGKITKEDVAFYFSEPKPDLIVTVNIKDYSKELTEQLNSFGFLLGSQILNIDNDMKENKKFGTMNLIEQKSLAEILLLIFSKQEISKKSAECLLASLILHTNGFKDNITAQVFETAGWLMKKGADLVQINSHVTT